MGPSILSGSSIALIIAFIAFMFMAKKSYNNKNINSKRKLPPGPWRLPIIGNMHQMLTSSLPHRCLADLAKKHGPVMYLKLGEVSNVVVSSRQAAEEVVRTNDVLLADRPVNIAASIILYNSGDIVFAPYGEYWRQLKKIFVLHLTSAKQVESFKSVREAEVTMLVREIGGSSNSSFPVNLSKMFHTLTASIISRAAFGDKCKRVDAFIPLVARISEIFSGFNIGDFFPSVGMLHSISGVKDKVVRLHQETDNVLDMVISDYKASRKSEKGNANDLLGVLLDMQDQGNPEDSLPTESIKGVLIDAFAGGIETGATLLQWTMSEIMKHPQVMKNVQEEVRQVFRNKSNIDEASLHQLKYMHAVIKETLRLHPPFPLLVPREARERVTINGYEIPAKTRVLINVWAIGRDRDIWTDAEKFYPERFLETSFDYKGSHTEFIPFGAGRRICPGTTFAMSTVELALANLLYHFDWKLSDGLEPEFLDMSEVPGAVVGRKHDLCLIAIPYQP